MKTFWSLSKILKKDSMQNIIWYCYLHKKGLKTDESMQVELFL